MGSFIRSWNGAPLDDVRTQAYMYVTHQDCTLDSNCLVITTLDIQVRVTPPLIRTMDIFLECLEYVF